MGHTEIETTKRGFRVIWVYEGIRARLISFKYYGPAHRFAKRFPAPYRFTL